MNQSARARDRKPRAQMPTGRRRGAWSQRRHAEETARGIDAERVAAGEHHAIAQDISYWLRRRLTAVRYSRPKVTIMDASGKAVAVYDPETRQRTPITEAT